jgi:methylthioribose-1-phosphate isomerase
MRINEKHYHSIWLDDENNVSVIDQRYLPHSFIIASLQTLDEVAVAIKDMIVRGAPLIGVTAAFGIYIAIRQYIEQKNTQPFSEYLNSAKENLVATRPTAVNLAWAVDKMVNATIQQAPEQALTIAKKVAIDIMNYELATSRQIGENGSKIISEIYKQKGDVVNIMTHCNAGWLATVDYGTALAPIYVANEQNIPIHVWVSETRPRNQGSSLTCFELANEHIPHTLVVDSACGHLMQKGKVDMIIVGADRIAANGDTANKIGTYMKAVVAEVNDIPFYVAAPRSTMDKKTETGEDIVIEERNPDEVLYYTNNATQTNFRVAPLQTNALNPAFDVTPKKYISGFITE